MEEVKALFDEVISESTKVKKLIRLTDPGQLVVPCIISGVEFHDNFCNAGSSVSIFFKDIAERFGLTTETSKLTLTFSNQSIKSPGSVVKDLGVRVGNYIVHGSNMPLIPGRVFMATSGTIVDRQKNIISFTNIDDNVYYKAVPEHKGRHLASCIGVCDIVSSAAEDIPEDLSDKSDVHSYPTVLVSINTTIVSVDTLLVSEH